MLPALLDQALFQKEPCSFPRCILLGLGPRTASFSQVLIGLGVLVTKFCDFSAASPKSPAAKFT